MPPKSPLDKANKSKRSKQPKKFTPEKAKKGKHPNSTPPAIGKSKKPKLSKKEKAKIKSKAEEQKKVTNGVKRRLSEPTKSPDRDLELAGMAEAEEEAAMNGVTGPEKEEVQVDHGMTFHGGENLASPQAGPSRLPMSTPIPAPSFTPLPRSILSGMSKRPTFSPSRSSSPIPGANIIIDENPSAVPVDSSSSGSHFEPPGLFYATLPAIQGPSTKNDKPTNVASTQGLLLPDNVVVDGVEKEGQAGGSRGSGSMEGLHFVDDNTQKGVTRYFVAEQTEEETFLATADQSKMCQNCKRPGHRAYACPHVICTVCGAFDEHDRKDCPHGLVCFGCGGRGHRQIDCPDPASRHSRKRGCDRCGSRDHPESACPTVWRVYAYWSTEQRKEVERKKGKAVGWHKEAVGGTNDDMFCYNCARPGHLGDDCPRPRASGAKRIYPSAFSHSMASRGPFSIASTSNRIQGTPTHVRFDEEDDEPLPNTTPGFAGGNAGRRTRDKHRQAMIDLEKEMASDDDDDDWFKEMKAGPSSRNDLTTRGRGKSTPNRNMPQQERSWGSDQRPTQGRNDPPRNMPFGHSHLMASAPAATRKQGISFGSLSTPGGSTASPSADKARNNKPDGSKGMLIRALKGSRKESQPSPAPSSSSSLSASPGSPLMGMSRSAKKRMRKEADEEDMESTWWKSGKAGGNVSNWGNDLPSPAPKGKKSKEVVRGNKGQQYTGGY